MANPKIGGLGVSLAIFLWQSCAMTQHSSKHGDEPFFCLAKSVFARTLPRGGFYFYNGLLIAFGFKRLRESAGVEQGSTASNRSRMTS